MSPPLTDPDPLSILDPLLPRAAPGPPSGRAPDPGSPPDPGPPSGPGSARGLGSPSGPGTAPGRGSVSGRGSRLEVGDDRGRGRGSRPRRWYFLRGRHVRERRVVHVGTALAAADIATMDDLLVLQVLRLRSAGDLDLAQVCAYSALPPSVVAATMDRLVHSGLVRDTFVDGRLRFGLP